MPKKIFDRERFFSLEKEELQRKVDSCSSMDEVYLKLTGTIRHYPLVLERLAEMGVSLEKTRGVRRMIQAERYKETILKKRLSVVADLQENHSSIFCENSSYDGKQIRALIRQYNDLAHWLVEKCEDCGLGKSWNGKKLVLQIDHKNGVGNDNRLENLRFICPNCHSQTETFTGRNIRFQRAALLVADRGADPRTSPL